MNPAERETTAAWIVAGADGSGQSLRAVEWATEEAARRGLGLRIVHAETPWLADTPVDPRVSAIREWLLACGRELLEQAVSAARERDPRVTVEGEAVPGAPSRVLLEQANEAAMVVVGGHGTGTVGSLVFGSTALQVVTHARVPVVVVRHVEPAVRREVVVGVDGSRAGEPALGFAFEEAAMRKARLRAVHVWSSPASSWPGRQKPLVYDPQDFAEKEFAASLAAWREKFPDVEVVSEVVHGRPVRILAGSSARADLLVVGTRGRGGFTGLLLGSVSQALLHHAHCPMAVVPSP
ncbi:universal stress protein [Actinomadura scrupuli]|uniref:universal stress protein n=1 Tax=Actinomadura scrupuli TaxID=559629 RepID=UPI003D9652AC